MVVSACGGSGSALEAGGCAELVAAFALAELSACTAGDAAGGPLEFSGVATAGVAVMDCAVGKLPATSDPEVEIGAT